MEKQGPDSDEVEDQQQGPPWVPALLVGVAIVLVLVFVFGRKDDSSGDATSGSGDTAEVADDGGADGDAADDGSGDEVEEAAPKATWPDEIKWKPSMTGEREQGLDQIPDEVPAGFYIWSDFQGWFVWLVDPAGKAGASGRITTNAEFGSAGLIEGATGDFLRGDSTLGFDFSGVHERATGFRFNPGFFTNEVTIDLDGDDLPVFLGYDATPMEAPFVLEKMVR